MDKVKLLLVMLILAHCVNVSAAQQSLTNVPPADATNVEQQTKQLQVVPETVDPEQLLAQQKIAQEQQQRLKTLVEFCTPCHGSQGLSKNAIYPNLAGQDQDYLLQQLVAYKNKTRKDDIMTGMVSRLSTEDMQALANYYATINSKSGTPQATTAVNQNMDHLAERYVKLTLLVGKHQDYYIDAYYGPSEWQQQATKQPLPELLGLAKQLSTELAQFNASEAEQLRKAMLVVQTRSVVAFIEQLNGKKLNFDQESMALYDAKSPNLNEADFAQALAKLDALLPGEGDLNERLKRFNSQFVIPVAKLDAVFSAAISESRKRTMAKIALPADESFTIEYVTNQPWSAYNWYKGNSFSLIQLNTDLPIAIDRAIDLASHEGYPGHHVFNSLMEKHLVNGKGWLEYSVYPLYSPLSLLAEGSANYGIHVAFNDADRIAFEQQVLFPLAGLDASKAPLYYQVQELYGQLSYAGNVAAKRYLDGELSKSETIAFLMKYAMNSAEKAEQRIGFFERYRAYVINYNLGQDLVKDYVESRSGANQQQRWQIFTELLANPKSASMLN